MATYHRIVKLSRGATALDGEGSKIAGGRWNPPGIPVAYLTESRALAALEILVHWGRTATRMQWALVSADVPDELIMKPEPGLLPEGWDALPSSPVSQKYGADWVMGGINLAISLPSSVIPEERNLLINVRHPDFVKIQISNPQPFYFDRRLG